MNAAFFRDLLAIIQQDPGARGLARDPRENLFNACPGDLADACRGIARTPRARLLIVTGFPIVRVDPVCGETDGPLGAVFLARALAPLGIEVAIAAESWCINALTVGLDFCNLRDRVSLIDLNESGGLTRIASQLQTSWTHLLALERVGPSHTLESIARDPRASAETINRFKEETTSESRDRCFSMRGIDLTSWTAPAHPLFELAGGDKQLTTIGIGDGGNEIGMGKIPWDTIRRNIHKGAQIACRIPTEHLIVAGVSNWGAYALAAGVICLRGKGNPALFDPDRERRLLTTMVEDGPLVDGVTGKREATVDGLSWDRYGDPLIGIGDLVKGSLPPCGE